MKVNIHSLCSKMSILLKPGKKYFPNGYICNTFLIDISAKLIFLGYLHRLFGIPSILLIFTIALACFFLCIINSMKFVYEALDLSYCKIYIL